MFAGSHFAYLEDADRIAQDHHLRPTDLVINDSGSYPVCNATARRSSTTCTTSSGQGKGEPSLGTQFDDERIDSVSYRSI